MDLFSVGVGFVACLFSVIFATSKLTGKARDMMDEATGRLDRANEILSRASEQQDRADKRWEQIIAHLKEAD